jgi:hypothetical protein
LDVFGLLLRVVEPAKSLWQRVRFGARVEIALTWQNPLVWVVGDPIDSTRAVDVRIIASKSEEYVVATGVVEQRLGWRWRTVGSVEDVFSWTLPWAIAQNRADQRTVHGPTIARRLRGDARPDEPVRLRVSVTDNHRTTLRSNVLTTTAAELQRQETT